MDLPNDEIRIVASFDELSLDVEFRYEWRLWSFQVSANLSPKFYKTKRRGAFRGIF